MDTIFINSQNIKMSDPYRLLLSFSEKITLKESDSFVALSNLSINNTWKIIKSHTKTMNIKNQVQRGMTNFSYLTDHIIYQMSRVTLSISSSDK